MIYGLIVYMCAVCERVCCHSHTLCGATLNVTMLESQPDVDVSAVKVTGILPTHSRDFISLYFESKRSGGGTVVALFVDREEGIAVVTFSSAHSMNVFRHVLLLKFLLLLSTFFFCELFAYYLVVVEITTTQ